MIRLGRAPTGEYLGTAGIAATRDRALRAGGTRARVLRGVRALHHADHAARRRRAGGGRGRGLRRSRPRLVPGGRRHAPAGRLLDARLVRRAAVAARRLPRPARARRVASLPHLGLRVGRARPRPAPGGALARRPARPRAPAAHVRGLDAAGRLRQRRARDLREDAARPRALPRHALQARPDQHLERRADRGAGRERRGRLARPQGPVQGHAGRRRDRPRAVREADRGLPRRVARGPRRQRRDAPGPRAGARPHHVGRPDPLRRTTCSRSSGSRAWSTSSRRAWARCPSSAAPTTSAPSAASAPTAAARPSWASGRDHIQYLAALFHPDTPNDVAPRGFNMPQLPDGMPASPIEIEPAATGFRFA